MFYRYDQYGWGQNSNQLFWQNPIDFQNMDGPFGIWNPPQMEDGPIPYRPYYYPGTYLTPFYQHNTLRPPIHPWISYFHDEKGKFDFNKMMSTFGQITNTVKQASPLFKSFGSFISKLQ